MSRVTACGPDLNDDRPLVGEELSRRSDCKLDRWVVSSDGTFGCIRITKQSASSCLRSLTKCHFQRSNIKSIKFKIFIYKKFILINTFSRWHDCVDITFNSRNSRSLLCDRAITQSTRQNGFSSPALENKRCITSHLCHRHHRRRGHGLLMLWTAVRSPRTSLSLSYGRSPPNQRVRRMSVPNRQSITTVRLVEGPKRTWTKM